MNSRAPETAEGPKRRPRYPINVEVTVTFGSRTSETSMAGRGYDVSENGLALFVPAELEIGQSVKLEFCVPGSANTFLFQGEVRNRDSFPGSYGVAFVGASEQRSLLSKCCSNAALARVSQAASAQSQLATAKQALNQS